MAITSNITNPGNVLRIATGDYLDTGTVAAFDLDIGFVPRYVKVFNETSGDCIEWDDSMADAEGFKAVAAGTQALVTSNGITPSADSDDFKGFTIGLDTDIVVTSEQLSWIAIG